MYASLSCKEYACTSIRVAYSDFTLAMLLDVIYCTHAQIIPKTTDPLDWKPN